MEATAAFDGVDGNVVPTKFDVLSDELPGGSLYVLDDYNDHQIGNNRLNVLIEMNHEAFAVNFNKNHREECEKIVHQIRTVTCHKGRFLCRRPTTANANNGGWKVLNEEEANELVRQALRSPLQHEQQLEELLESLEPLEVESMTRDSTFEPLPLSAAAGFANLVLGNDDDDDYYGPSSALQDLGQNLELIDDATSDKKRGRRRSLLRRSVSESNFDKKKTYRNQNGEVSLSELMPNGMPQMPAFRRFHSNADQYERPYTTPEPPSRGLQRAATVSSEGHNKTTRTINHRARAFGGGGGRGRGLAPYSPAALAHQQSSLSSSTSIPEYDNNNHTYNHMDFQMQQHNQTSSLVDHGNVIVPTYSGMDVVLRNDCKALSPKKDIVGNNRLNVIMSLQKPSYHTKSLTEQTRVASDLVETVTSHWNAKILVDKGFAYNQLGYHDSVAAMKALLATSSTSSSVTGNVTRGNLLSSVSSGTATASMMSSVSSNFSASSSLSSSAAAMSSSGNDNAPPLLASAPPVPDFLRHASMEILNGGRDNYNTTGPEQMQSAAIRSLQRRKAKRQMAKGLGPGRKESGGRSGTKSKEGSSSSTSSSLSPTPSGSDKDPQEPAELGPPRQT